MPFGTFLKYFEKTRSLIKKEKALILSILSRFEKDTLIKFDFLIQYLYSKWFEPRSISSSCSVIVRVSVVLKRTVGDSD